MKRSVGSGTLSAGMGGKSCLSNLSNYLSLLFLLLFSLLGSQEAWAQSELTLKALPNVESNTLYPGNAFNSDTYRNDTKRNKNYSDSKNYFGIYASNDYPVVVDNNGFSFPNSSSEHASGDIYRGFIAITVGCGGNLTVSINKKPQITLDETIHTIGSSWEAFQLSNVDKLNVGDVLTIEYEANGSNPVVVFKKTNSTQQGDGDFTKSSGGTSDLSTGFRGYEWILTQEDIDQIRANNNVMYCVAQNIKIKSVKVKREYSLHIGSYNASSGTAGWDWTTTNKKDISNYSYSYTQSVSNNGLKTLYIGATRDVYITQISWTPTFDLSVSPTDLSLEPGQTATLTATMTGDYPTLRWESNDRGVKVTQTSNNGNGVITATVTANGKCNATVTATATEQGGATKTANTSVNVTYNGVYFARTLRCDLVTEAAEKKENFMVPSGSNWNKKFLIMANDGKSVNYNATVESEYFMAADGNYIADDYCLYFGGGGNETQRCVRFTPEANGQLYVYAKVGNSHNLTLKASDGSSEVKKTGTGGRQEYIFDIVAGKTYSLYTDKNGWWLYYIGSTVGLEDLIVPKNTRITIQDVNFTGTNESKAVSHTIEDADGGDYTLTFTSNKTNVVEVTDASNGSLRSLRPGSATITATLTINPDKYHKYSKRVYTATCAATVPSSGTLQPVPGPWPYIWDGESFGAEGTQYKKALDNANPDIVDGDYLQIFTNDASRYVTAINGDLVFYNPGEAGVKFIAPVPGKVTVEATIRNESYSNLFWMTGVSGSSRTPAKAKADEPFIETADVTGAIDNAVFLNMKGGSGNNGAKINWIKYEPYLIEQIKIGGEIYNVDKDGYDVYLQVPFTDNGLQNATFEAIGVTVENNNVDLQYNHSNLDLGRNQEIIRTVTASLNGVTLEYHVHVQCVELEPLTGSYKWHSGRTEYPNFGRYKLYNDKNLPNIVGEGAENVQHYHLQLNPDGARSIEVKEDGLHFNSPATNNVKFIVPGAGLIRVKANTRTAEKDAYFVIGESMYQFPYRDADLTKVYMYEYEEEAQVPVAIRFEHGGTYPTRYVESIEYVRIHKLEDYTTKYVAKDFVNAGIWGGSTEFSQITNSTDNYCRFLADDDHKIKIVSNGYQFVGESSREDLVGYIEVSTHTPGTLKVWAIGTDASSRVKVSGGEIPKDRDIEIKSGDASYTLTFIDNDPTRNVFVGGTDGVIITKIEWTPSEMKNANRDDFKPVSTEHPTTWAKWNNYGGFAIKADGENSNDIQVNLLNPGLSDSDPDAHTLMIYGENMGKDDSRTNFSKNGILTLGASPSNKAYASDDWVGKNPDGWNDDHFVEFKVTTRGVLKVTGAGNGPNGRHIRAGLDLTTELLISNESSKPSHQNNNDNQEHEGEFVRHQHDSNHTFYFYYDGSEASADHPVSIFIFGRGGTNFDEITWYPDVDIESTPGVKAPEGSNWGGELNPENALKICEEDATIIRDSKPAVSRRLYINQANADYANKVYSTWEGQTKDNYYRTFNSDGYYEMYANVNTQDRKVTLENMTPVWKTSQDGRGGYRENKVVDVIKEDLRNGFSDATVSNYPAHQELLVSKPFQLKPKVKSIVTSEDGMGSMGEARRKATGKWSKLKRSKKDGSDHPGFGIVYIVAGTQEGNRVDDRRVEIAGPASGLDVITPTISRTENIDNIDYLIHQVKAVAGKPSKLQVNPFLTYVDLNVGGNNGEDVRIKVDNPTVTWYESDKVGTPKSKSDCILTLVGGKDENGYTTNKQVEAVTTSNGVNTLELYDDKHVSVKDLSTLTFQPKDEAANQITYITAVIWGIEEVRNDKGAISYYRYKEYSQTFEIDIKENGLYLERVVPFGTETEENGVVNVSVADPIVFRAYGAIDHDGDDVYVTGKLAEGALVTEGIHVTSNSLPLFVGDDDEQQENCIEVPLTTKVIDGEIYFVYDIVGRLQALNVDQHLFYSTKQYAKFTYTGKTLDNNWLIDGGHIPYVRLKDGGIYPYIGGSFFRESDATDADKERILGEEKHKQYNFKFTTEDYEIGSELETYIYNVSQRTNADIQKDLNNKRMLYENIIETRNNLTYGTAKPWSCNWRSYLEFSDGIVAGAVDNTTGSLTEGLITTYNASSGSFIEIKPYNKKTETFRATKPSDNTAEKQHKRHRKGLIKQIEVNCLPTYGSGVDNTGTITIYKKNGEFATETKVADYTINADNNYTAICTFDPTGDWEWPTIANLTDYAKIVFTPSNSDNVLKIDQVKVVYYSGEENGRPLKLLFDAYHESMPDDPNDWGKIVAGEIDIETQETLKEDGYGLDDTEPNVILKFVDNNKRHFMVRERWTRAESDDLENGIYRGEKLERQTDPVDGRTTLIMRDDKTDPFRMYFYTKDNVAEISKIEFICEDDNVVVEEDVPDYESNNVGTGNNKTPRNLYCTSDPRYNPTSANNYVGYPLEIVDKDPVSGKHLVLNDGTRVHKLVYRPESPVNFAFVAGDPNQEGFFFVRQIIVTYDKNARSESYKLLNPNYGLGDFTSSDIGSVALNTHGLQLRIPEENDVKAYTVKRTSTRTNISSERVLSRDKSMFDEDAVREGYEMPVLCDQDPTSFRNYLHRKFYTVRALDHNRMVMRQLGFRTVEQSKPQVKRDYTGEIDGKTWVTNTELYAEEPVKTLKAGDIEITRTYGGSTTSDHRKSQQLLIWTDDASAPAVEFGPNGRTVMSIHGFVTAGDQTLNSEDYFGSTSDGKLGKKSIVFKAISMALDLGAGEDVSNLGITSGYYPGAAVPDHTGTSSASLLAAINNKGTFGETTAITRANYVYAKDGETYFTTARREADGLSVILDHTTPLNLNGEPLKNGDGTNVTLDQLYSMHPDKALELDDKFHAGYHTSIVKDGVEKVKMIHGGYELYAQKEYDSSFNPTGNDEEYPAAFDGETYRADRFRRNIIANDIWRVAGNDLTPYRGLPGVIGGDAYLISDLAPLNEKATYTIATNKIAHGSTAFTDMSADNLRRAFPGEFDFAKHNSNLTQHDKLWNIPCYGDYFQYEPKADGRLTVHVKQQGVMEQKEDGTLDDKLIRFRPVFILDEAGNTPEDIHATTTSKVSGDWMSMTHTKNVASKYLNPKGQDNLYDMCQAWLEDNTKDTSKDPQIEYGDRAYHEQGVIAVYGTLDNAKAASGKNLDGTDFVYSGFEAIRSSEADNKGVAMFGERSGNANGFMLISEGYVKYDFPVKAGKTYFVFAANGNLGLCSYQFNENADFESKKLKCDIDYQIKVNNEVQTNASDGVFHIGDVENNDAIVDKMLASGNYGKTADVVLHRSFQDGKWAGLVLPFSVSKKQLREALGDGVKVAHFEKVNNMLLYTRRHVHQMVVAGTPVFVKPTKTVTALDGITFNNVTIEDVSEVKDQIPNQDADYPSYICKGSYRNSSLTQYSFYIRAADGKFGLRTLEGSMAMKPTRAWIEYTGGVSGRAVMSAKGMVTSTYSFVADTGEGVDGDIATDVEEYLMDDVEEGDGNVYNLKGQLVRRGTEDLEGLPQGVYIINGVKHVVK